MEDGMDAQPLSVRSDTDRDARPNKTRMANAINYLHCQGRTVFAVFRHAKYNTSLTVEANPFPCHGDYLHLTWRNPEDLRNRSRSYEFREVLLSVGRGIFSFQPQVVTIDDKGAGLDISSVIGKDVSVRKVDRHACTGVDAEILQNGLSFRGRMNHFTALSFSVTVSPGNFLPFAYFNRDIPTTLLIRKSDELFYSGECRITHDAADGDDRTFILEPVTHHLHRFTRKKHRSPRHRLHPSPMLVFAHPLTGRTISLGIDEIAGSGFSVIEAYESATLMPGLILPKAEIEFAFGFTVACKTQVVSRNVLSDSASPSLSPTYVRCGVAILDMDARSQTMMASVLQRATNKNSSVCNRVDLDDLWRFFFLSGFIYPKKYCSLQHNLDTIKETYRKLYLEHPDIARHFVYVENGEIEGHISMVRVYEKTWLFHHHASTGAGRAGIVVLDQIGRYVNDFGHMASANLEYIICYFRPENHFPKRVFGGFHRLLANPKGCSMDDFFHVLLRRKTQTLPFSGTLTLEPSTPADLNELSDYYNHVSGGLMLTAFDLDSAGRANMAIKKTYEDAGMKRDWHLFSLREDRSLKAIFVANISEAGLNMSNLTNCVTAFVLDSEGLSADSFLYACNEVLMLYHEDEVPLLIHPVSYEEKIGLSGGKIYTLWAFSTEHLDLYLDYVYRLTKRQGLHAD